MTTPEGPPHGNPADQPADRPAWGQQPAGGWGGPSRDPAEETRAWGEPAPGDADATRVEQPGVWGPPGPPAQPGAWGAGQQQPGAWGAPQQQAPAWAQQPPPVGGWNEGPGRPGSPQPGYGRPQGGYPQGGQPGWAPPGAEPQWPGGPQGRQGQPPPWGPGYPPLPGPPGNPGRSRTPLIVVAALVVLVGVGAFLGWVAPGFFYSTVFDQAALQSGVQRVLTDDYQLPAVGDVTCGDPARGPIAVREGDTFTCSTTIDGVPATVPVRITSDGGDYEVSRPAS